MVDKYRNKFIISALHHYSDKDEYEWKYVSRVKPTPDKGFGTPCWTSFEENALVFRSIIEARKFFENNKKYLNTEYDIINVSSLAVRKKIYKVMENLTL